MLQIHLVIGRTFNTPYYYCGVYKNIIIQSLGGAAVAESRCSVVGGGGEVGKYFRLKARAGHSLRHPPTHKLRVARTYYSPGCCRIEPQTIRVEDGALTFFSSIMLCTYVHRYSCVASQPEYTQSSSNGKNRRLTFFDYCNWLSLYVPISVPIHLSMSIPTLHLFSQYNTLYK